MIFSFIIHHSLQLLFLCSSWDFSVPVLLNFSFLSSLLGTRIDSNYLSFLKFRFSNTFLKFVSFKVCGVICCKLFLLTKSMTQHVLKITPANVLWETFFSFRTALMYSHTADSVSDLRDTRDKGIAYLPSLMVDRSQSSHGIYASV